jgi:hypothetical protein
VELTRRSCAKLSYVDAQGVVQGTGLPAGKVTNAQDVKDVEGDLRLLKVSGAMQWGWGTG